MFEKMLTFNIIVAVDAENGIGKNGHLPWHLLGDMGHFKKITMRRSSNLKRNVLVMGRKTWESIPVEFRPLSGRINIILTKNKDLLCPSGVILAGSLDQTFRLIEEMGEDVENIFFIGGQQVFQQVVGNPGCKRIYLTQILKTYCCDTFFPEIKESFKRGKSSSFYEENMVNYHFVTYEREEGFL